MNVRKPTGCSGWKIYLLEGGKLKTTRLKINLRSILNSSKYSHPLKVTQWTAGSTEKRSIRYFINLTTSSMFESQTFQSLDKSESSKNRSNSIL